MASKALTILESTPSHQWGLGDVVLHVAPAKDDIVNEHISNAGLTIQMRLWQLGVQQEITRIRAKFGFETWDMETVSQLRMAVTESASLGMIPGTHSHLVPFRNNKRGSIDIQLIRNFEGVKFFLERSGVEIEPAQYIHQNDEIKISQRIGPEGQEQIIEHFINPLQDRGNIVAAYITYRRRSIIDANRIITRVVMRDIEYFEKVRSFAAKKRDSGWSGDFWEQMIPKTLILRIPKQEQLNMPSTSGEVLDELDEIDQQIEQADVRTTEVAKPVALPKAKPKAIEAPKADPVREGLNRVAAKQAAKKAAPPKPPPEPEPEPVPVAEPAPEPQEIQQALEDTMGGATQSEVEAVSAAPAEPSQRPRRRKSPFRKRA